MKIFITLIVLLVLFSALVCYSACVVAGRADEWEEEQERKNGKIH